MLRLRLLILAAALPATLSMAPLAWALPDLVPDIGSVTVVSNATVDPGDVLEGCAAAETGRELIRFGIRTENTGPDDLILGDPGCPDCAQNPGATCANPFFECSEAHGHPHFHGFIHAELLDEGGTVVAEGHKHGFCLLDLDCANPVYTCGYQGISAGCADIYVEGLPCQYIDITDEGLAPGHYSIRVKVDAEEDLAEEDETNNVATAPVVIGTPPPTCPVYAASDLPQPIVDLTTTTSTITAPSTSVDRVRIVNLSGQHTYMQDLEFRLRSPSGTEVIAVNRVCGGNPGFALDVADTATQPIPCPPDDAGLYLPSQPLAAFGGEDSAGVWTLEVHDLVSGDEGLLNTWGLEVCSRCGNGTLDPGEVCDDGNLDEGDCCSADCQSPAPDGGPCGDAEQCKAGGTCVGGSCVGAVVSCDPCLTCQPPAGCVAPAALLCSGLDPSIAKLKMTKDLVTGARDSISWTWKSGAPVSIIDFGAPDSVTDMSFCVFEGDDLVLSATAPAAGLCGLGPCWRASEKSILYKDRDGSPDGLVKMVLKPGDAGRASIKIKGKGPNLGLGPLGFSGDLTARLIRADGTPCWESRFGAPKRNDERKYSATVSD